MKPRYLRLAGVLLLALGATAPALAAGGATFQLTATDKDFDTYFPGYLANGYFSTMTSVRGTEPAYGYMVALMDYTKDDIARPAAIPGWSEIDYNPGGGWLNSIRLDKSIYSGYSQTLDMHDGTLSTRYRFNYANKSSDIGVETFVSQADQHLAATRLTITPQFDGEVELTFPIRLWSDHQPRFPIGKLTGDEMIAAVIASGQNLQNKPVPTPDRAAVWYPGVTRIVAADGDTDNLTLSVDARAEQGLEMAEALAVELPKGLEIVHVALEKGPHKLSLNLTARVHKGTSYAFTKYVAASRKDWGGDARADLALAVAARKSGFDRLIAAHRSAWNDLWKTDIIVDGNDTVQKAIHSDLYYLLSNTTTGTAWPMGACALTPGYAGHAFWDSDSWVFPALLLLHPERAKPIVMFRQRTLAAAQARAKQFGVKGAMYPWEADPETGVDYTPHFAEGVQREVHVNADIAIAQWQYYLASGDKAWLKEHGWPVIEQIATFWVSRVTWMPETNRYEILHVTSPDEAYSDVPNDSFTNAAARKALTIAIEAAKQVGATPDPKWADIVAKMYIPFKESEQRHLDFDESVPHDKITWMGSSLVWLMYPNLDLPMTPAIRRNNFDFQIRELKEHGDDPNEMMMVMLAVGAAELGDAKTAGEWIERNLVGFVKPPFNVRTETAVNNAGYILSTSAGYIQSFVYGLSGLRIDDKGLSEAYAPVLPPDWKSLKLQRISFRGKHYDITVDRDAQGHARLTRRAL
ncbi:MAG TPA: glycosyl hydrolase family 65 protein [Luteibacter sp.]|jgi:trehalose/maltose hydrolase-like predicted phosphorylase|nr:glycosyl hydrolase family 65 protein [Luteibacter sp.]